MWIKAHEGDLEAKLRFESVLLEIGGLQTVSIM